MLIRGRIFGCYEGSNPSHVAYIRGDFSPLFFINHSPYKKREIGGIKIKIFYERMIEVDATEKEEAYERAKEYFESFEKREILDGELAVCRMSSMIGVL